WRRRDGLVLRLVDDDGRVGRGEASPLPGYSPDDRDACAASLAAVDVAALAIGGGDLLEGVRAAVARIDARLPAARFAVETALLDLAAQRLGTAPHRLLGGGDRPPRSCALVEDVAGARAARARGVDCF